jgi:hypothetical protein
MFQLQKALKATIVGRFISSYQSYNIVLQIVKKLTYFFGKAIVTAGTNTALFLVLVWLLLLSSSSGVGVGHCRKERYKGV